ELGDRPLTAALAARGELPGIADGETVALRARPVLRLAIVMSVVGRATADDCLELVLCEALEPRSSDFPRAQRHPPRDLPVEAQAILRRGGADRHDTGRGHHPAVVNEHP